MVGHTLGQVAEIYACVDSLPHHHAIRRIVRSGFVLGPEIELPDKRARLAYLERAVFERGFPA